MSVSTSAVTERSFFAVDVPQPRRDEIMEYLESHPNLLSLCNDGKVEQAARAIEASAAKGHPEERSMASALRNCAAFWTS